MKNQEVRWVVGGYQGERAKSVLAHAHAGIGYQILEQSGGGANSKVLAAFRTGELPIPDHLTEVIDPYKIELLEKKRQR